MTWLDVEQNTDLWLDVRPGKVTGSRIAAVMANFGKPFGNPAKKLVVDIAIEQLTGQRQWGGYSNADMERGHREEPLARKRYEEEYFVDVTNGGFYDNGKTGCSPDGHVNNDGLVEFKSAIPSIHYERIRKGTVDYKWQCIFNLRESKREWIDFVSYCSLYPYNTQLFIRRLELDNLKKEYQMIDDRLGEFFTLLKTVKERIQHG